MPVKVAVALAVVGDDHGIGEGSEPRKERLDVTSYRLTWPGCAITVPPPMRPSLQVTLTVKLAAVVAERIGVEESAAKVSVPAFPSVPVTSFAGDARSG